VEGDVRDLLLMKTLLKEADCVFHEAARVSVRASLDQYYDDADTNLMGTLNMLRACAGSRVRKFVYASSMAVYADSAQPVPETEDYRAEPLSPYGIAKLASEKYCLMMCRQYGIDGVVLRYFNTFGPRQTLTPYVGVITIFINKLLRGESPIIFGDGRQTRDFVHVEDIAEANLCALKAAIAGEILNVGTGTPTTVSEIADLLRVKINPSIPVRYGDEQQGEIKISIADISRARAKIGYHPRWNLHNRIDDVIEYIKRHSHP
jgi:UDP-glucose 4-epimerase